jgi:hypothetical protein
MHDHKDAFEKAMRSSSKKSSGGPQTAKGKRVSSQNALVHGATSNNAFSAEQRVAVEQYVQELTDFYKPESPLGKLQIQRIALCKAKLDALYQLEQVKLQIASEDLKRTPELVMQKIEAGGEMTQAFAETLSKGRELELPMGLTPESLALISSEINAIGGKLDSEDDLNIALPNLSLFIKGLANRLGSSPYKILLRIGETVNGMLKEKGAIGYKLRQLLQSMKKAKQDEIYGESPVDELVVAVEVEPDLNKINEALGGIVQLNSVVKSAHEVAKDFMRMKELMLSSVTLSGEESDRLLRYQTTWERRLSSAIGELLALQGKNGK